jgi:hypothetical protein
LGNGQCPRPTLRVHTRSSRSESWQSRRSRAGPHHVAERRHRGRPAVSRSGGPDGGPCPAVGRRARPGDRAHPAHDPRVVARVDGAERLRQGPPFVAALARARSGGWLGGRVQREAHAHRRRLARVRNQRRRTNGAMVTTSHPATQLVANAQPARGQPREQALDVNARAARATASDRRVRGSCRSTSSSSTIRTMRCFIVL